MLKTFWQNFFAFLNDYYYLQTQLIKALNSRDSARPNERLSQNPNTGGLRELVLPGHASTVKFPKKIYILVAWKPIKA